jgi:hypothetical protein
VLLAAAAANTVPPEHKYIETKWRKRVGVEPTGDTVRCHPPVLKTGTITGLHALPSIYLSNLLSKHRAKDRSISPLAGQRGMIADSNHDRIWQ